MLPLPQAIDTQVKATVALLLPQAGDGRDEGGRASENCIYVEHLNTENGLKSAFRQSEPPSPRPSPACGRGSFVDISTCVVSYALIVVRVNSEMTQRYCEKWSLH